LSAVEDDSRDLLDAGAIDDRVSRAPEGTLFLRVGYGLLAEPGGLYPPDLLAEHARRYPQLDIRQLEDVNHYTLLLGHSGAAAVTKLIEEVVR